MYSSITMILLLLLLHLKIQMQMIVLRIRSRNCLCKYKIYFLIHTIFLCLQCLEREKKIDRLPIKHFQPKVEKMILRLNSLFRKKWQMWMILIIRFYKITKIQCTVLYINYCLFIFYKHNFNQDLSSSSKVKTCRIRIIIYCKASVFLFTGLCIVFMVALHATEKRCICLMKWNLPYFWNTKMNALVYVDIDQGIY